MPALREMDTTKQSQPTPPGVGYARAPGKPLLKFGEALAADAASASASASATASAVKSAATSATSAAVKPASESATSGADRRRRRGHRGRESGAGHLLGRHSSGGLDSTHQG